MRINKEEALELRNAIWARLRIKCDGVVLKDCTMVDTENGIAEITTIQQQADGGDPKPITEQVSGSMEVWCDGRLVACTPPVGV